MKILLIDDDLHLTRSMRRALAAHQLTIENDGERVLACVSDAAAEGEPFDAVLCDFNMPGRSGVEVLGALRCLREPPILLLMSGDPDMVFGVTHADHVLIKPFLMIDIVAAIEAVAAQRSGATTRPLPVIRAARA